MLFWVIALATVTGGYAQDSLRWKQLLMEARLTASPQQAIPLAVMALDACEQQGRRADAVECLHYLGVLYQQMQDIPTALRYFLQALKTKESLGDTTNILILHHNLAELYNNWGVFEKSFEHFAQIARKTSDGVVKQSALEGMAQSKLLLGEQETALRYYLELRALQQRLNVPRQEMTTLRQIIKIHKDRGQVPLALQANVECLQLSEVLGDTTEMIVSHNNAGVLYRQEGQLEQALEAFLKAAELENSTYPIEGSNPVTLTNIGILYQNLGDYQQSLAYLFDALAQLKSRKPLDLPMLANVNNLIAIIYLTINDYNNAYQYNQSAILHARNMPDKELEQICYKTQASIFEQVNNYEDALHYFRLHAGIRDSLRALTMEERELALQKRYSAEQTEKEMSLLIVDREVEALRLRQELLENERLRQEKALQSSLLDKERLERQQTEQALLFAQQELEQEQASQNLLRTQQQLQAEQKDRQIAQLEREQSEQTLRLTQQRLEAEQQGRQLAQGEREKMELDLALQEKDFQLRSEQEKLIRNSIFGVLATALIILLLLYRNNRLRRKANKILGEQKQALETALHDLKQTQSRLVQAEKMASLGELTAGIAHEINNPLNFVTTNAHALKLDLQDIAQLLEEVHGLKENSSSYQTKRILQKVDELDTEFLKEEIKELIESIERGAERTKNIVAGLRIFSRKSVDDQFAAADLHEGLESTLTILGSKLKNRIEVIRDYGNLPPVNCQFDKLNQVFMNIISNAIQAIDGEGTICISTRQLEGQVQIMIEDNGKGMPPEVQHRIFEPFFTTKEVGEGTGLGLSISYGIIDMHNGKIEVQSAVGSGTKFIISLPI